MRPFRTVMLWQLAAIAAIATAAAIPWGIDGALSAILGGSINVAAGGAYAWMVSRRKARSAGEALVTLFKAEAVKVFTIIALLGIALTAYRSVVNGVFIGSFVVTVAIFAAAIAVREHDEGKTPS